MIITKLIKKIQNRSLKTKLILFLFTIGIEPTFGFFETENAPAWQINVMTSYMVWSENGGTLSTLSRETYARTLNLLEIIDPNLFEVNNLRIKGKTINFTYWEGELGYWGLLNYNLALGLAAKFYFFNNGWKVIKDTYNAVSNPADNNEQGDFSGNQYGIGPFIAFTPTDELIFKLLYRFSYQHYQFGRTSPTDFVLPQAHFSHYLEHHFEMAEKFSWVSYLIQNQTFFLQNSKKDNYFGYSGTTEKFDWQLFNQADIHILYEQFFLNQNFATGLVWAKNQPTYLGKSIFKFLNNRDLSLYGIFPKSVPAHSAWIFNYTLTTDNILQNFLNFTLATSVGVVSQQDRSFLKNPKIFIGGEFGIIFNPKFTFFKQVMILTYSFGYQFDIARRDQIISFYLSPES